MAPHGSTSPTDHHQEPVLRTCNFGTLCDSMIRDQIIIGVQDKRLRMQWLKEADVTLERAASICQSSESTKIQLKSFDKEIESTTIDVVHHSKKRTNKKLFPNQKTDCDRCGGKHALKECPAYRKDCRKCGGKKNNYAKCCFTKYKSACCGTP